jgi:uncharacterized protein with gpF-like domain
MSNLDKTTEQLEKLLDERIEGSERAVAKRYTLLLDEIKKEIAKLYEQYETDGVLTYAEMAKYDRLKKFLAYINHLLTKNYNDVKQSIYDTLNEVYTVAYYQMAWAIETDTLSKLAYSTVTPETITKTIENPIAGLTLSETLEKNRRNIIYKIQQEVTQGLVRGETYRTMAKRLTDTLEGDVRKAARIVRTESHRCSQQAQLDSAVHASKHGVVTMKEWGSMEDRRVRKGDSNHRKLDGKKIPLDASFDDGLSEGLAPGQLMGVNSARSNINCRCILFYSVEKVEKVDVKELEGMAFDTWKKERLSSKRGD